MFLGVGHRVEFVEFLGLKMIIHQAIVTLFSKISRVGGAIIFLYLIAVQ